MHVAKLSKNVSLAYNSDLSGMKIHIYEKETDSFPIKECDIDYKVLLDVIIDNLKSEKISEIEQMTSKDFIKKFLL